MSNFSKQENKELLALYNDLRLADVRDGLDWMGYHHYGSVDPTIRPLYRTKAIGIAKTLRYLPFMGPDPTIQRGEAYEEWMGWYYNNVGLHPWVSEVEDGDFICADVSSVHVGLIGSENTLACLIKGVRGFVVDGQTGIRDTDEVILQKVPCWSRGIGNSMVHCRLQYESHNKPIALGGCAVFPGDVIFADGDGVLVVPRNIAKDVAKFAHKMLADDKITRRKHYEILGFKPDHTVI